MPEKDWSTEESASNGLYYTWERFEVVRERVNNPFPAPTRYAWEWVAKYRGRTIKRGDGIENLMAYCEMFDRHRGK